MQGRHHPERVTGVGIHGHPKSLVLANTTVHAEVKLTTKHPPAPSKLALQLKAPASLRPPKQINQDAHCAQAAATQVAVTTA